MSKMTVKTTNNELGRPVDSRVLDCYMEKLSVCYCSKSEEARHISKYGNSHVHCSCTNCNGKATWRMTAWRHLKCDVEPPTKLRIVEASGHDGVTAKQISCVSETANESACLLLESPPDNLNLCNDANGISVGFDLTDVSDEEEEIPDVNQDSHQLIKEFVDDSILRLIEMKEKMHCSENQIIELLEWVKRLHTSGINDSEQYWPKNWHDVEMLLKRIGFVEPKLYWICLRKDHPSHYGLMESQDECCQYCGQTGNIPYYYMSLIERVKSWCSNKKHVP